MELGWISFEHPKTMVCVGGEYILTHMGSIFSVLETKTKTVTSVKPDQVCGIVGVNFAAGHKRIPFLAIVDAVLMPTVHVLTLPDLQLHCSFHSPRVTLYLDLRFSDNDLLIGLTDRPDFLIRIWNLRTQTLICEHKTMVPCHPRSLLLTSAPTPTIFQFSMLRKKIYLYEMCTQSKQSTLYELSEVALPKEYENVTHSSFSVSEDAKFYVINECGAMSRIIAGQSAVIPEWKSPYMTGSGEASRHDLYGCHQGMLVVTKERVMCIHSKNNTWHIEWQLENLEFPIYNLSATFYNEIYVANELSCIYRLEVKDNHPTLVAMSTAKFKVIDYCIPNALKDEIIILLSMHNTLMFTDVAYPNVYAEFKIPDSECIAGHPTLPYVMIGTRTGKVYIYNFEKIKAPNLVCVVENLNDAVISQVIMVENMIVAIGEHGNFYLIEADYKSGAFTHFGTIEEDISGKNHALGVVFSDPERLMVFVGHERIRNMPVARNMWVLEIKRKKLSYSKLVYTLPANYIWFTCTGRQKRAIEFCGIQYNSKIIDLYVLRPNGHLKIEASLMTEHFCSIEGASFSKNLLTYGADGSLMHFRYDKRASAPYRISKRLQKKFRPRPTKKCDECFNFKYTIFLFVDGLFRVDKILAINENLLENTELPVDTAKVYVPKKPEVKRLILANKVEVIEYTEEQLAMPDKIREMLKDLSVEVSELIDYDMSVTGNSAGIFRKFCLNNMWLMMLTEQTRQLLNIERQSLEQCTTEQERIRDWIKSLIMRHSDMINYKLRALYSTANFENYAIQKSAQELKKEYDLFRFYADEGRKNEDDDDDASDVEVIGNIEEEEGAAGDLHMGKKRFAIEAGKSIFEHVMSPEFAIQDINSVTVNQFRNDAVKFRMILKDALKIEFNKLFYEVQEYKRDVLVNVKATNTTLTKIYDNMNIMLRLLKMETFTPPELSVPEWTNDELLERILEVDESEVKAINRRKKKAMAAEVKVGRMLLWSVDFWVRALLTMMDGVLEKLWEEEIKKDIPIPEFMLKKSPHDYTLEDQRLLREYEEKVRQLEADRRKYLKILRDNEKKTMHQKTNHVLKINERITEMSILKFKYDFAISHCVLRVLNTNMAQLQRIETRQTINTERSALDRLHNYSTKYMNLAENWEVALQDVRAKLETATAKDKLVEKQFRGHFLANAPSHMSNELLKLYKRRPKITLGVFNSMIMCFEVALALTQKSTRQTIPLPKEAMDFLAHIDSIDDTSNCPPQLEIKYWDGFCKLRRLRLESELRLRGIHLHLAELTNDKAWFNKEINANKAMRTDKYQKLNDTVDQYVETVQNMSLQITLSMGQVEVRTKGSAAVLKDTVLMHVDDINAVNALIKAAGRRKLRAMQRVAAFRRQVIYKEWEHKMVSANIAYLKYMLNVIEKCKVSKEFLDILRKWDKVKKNREYMQSVGVIERVVAQKIEAYRKNLERLVEKIEKVQMQIDEVRTDNRRVDRKIDAIKVQVTMASLQRDELMEEKRKRELQERMFKIRTQRQLMDNVRRDYSHILELNTILELQRLRTYPTLGPAPPDCPPLKEFEMV